LKNLSVSALLDFYSGILTDKQYQFTVDYYNNDLSLAEIAENESITRQGVRDTIKRAEERLFDIEKTLGLVKKANDSKKRIDEISRNSQNIIEYNLRYNGSKEIDGYAKKIETLAAEINDSYYI